MKKIKTKLKKLNICCGKDIKEGYINLDSYKLKGVDIVHNLDKFPYQFGDNTLEGIYCSQILEHLREIKKPIEELHRISKPKGKIIMGVPIFTSSNAINNPTHKSFFTIKTFDFFSGYQGKTYYNVPKFKIIKKRILFHRILFPLELLFNLSESAQNFHNSFLCYIFPAIGLHFELEVLK